MQVDKKLEKIIESYIDGFSIDEKNLNIGFHELGLDSMDVMGIFTDLESEYGIFVSDEDFHKYNTISDIYKLIE